MAASSAVRERDFLQTLVPGYEAEGFSVFLHPAHEMLPPFMRGYQPDAIAVKDDKKIAIEIKRDATRRAARMVELQRIFSKHPEKKMSVYYIPGRPEEQGIQTPDLAAFD